MPRKTAAEELQEKYEGKTVTVMGTEEGDIVGVVTAVEADGTLEVTLENGEEYIIDPNDFKIEIGEVTEITVEAETEGTEKEETETPPDETEVPEITVSDIRKIDDTGILKKLIKENNLKPSLSVYKTVEAMQEFLIAELTKGETKKEQPKETVKVSTHFPDCGDPKKTESIITRKTTTVKPEQKTVVKKTEPKPKVEKKVSQTEFICDVIKTGDLETKSIVAKVLKNFDTDEKHATANVAYIVNIANRLK